MLLQVFLDVHVDEIRLELPDPCDVRRLRSADARTIDPFRKDAEVGDADNRVAGTEGEECLGERWDERDHSHFGAKKSPGFQRGRSGALAIARTSRRFVSA